MKSRVVSMLAAVLAVLVLQGSAYAPGDAADDDAARSMLRAAGQDGHPSGPGAVINVAPPTGDPATDRANIEAAIALAKPGDTVLFARGTYVIGLPPPSTAILVPVGSITLLGNAEGTTIHGGEVPDDFSPQPGFSFVKGGNTVRRLTFESFSVALSMGFDGPPSGGYTIADNVFKEVYFGTLGLLQSSDPTRITRNQYINVAWAFGISGRVMHFTGNTNRVPDPEAIPRVHKPNAAGFVRGFVDLECSDNVIENNVAEGNVDGFSIAAEAGATCKRSVIRNNLVTINKAVMQEGDFGTLVGLGSAGGTVDNILVEGNFMDGTMGYGIFAVDVTNSTIQGNSVRDVRKNSTLPPPFAPGGVAILLAGSSRGNAIASNQLRASTVCDVVLRKGTRNNVVVELAERALDRGRRNLVLSRSSCGADPSALASETMEDQFTMPEKLKIALDELKRLRSRGAAGAILK